MADWTAKSNLEEQLNCSICLDTYTNPKLLLCFHVYCQDCLLNLVSKAQQDKLSITCPACRQVTPLPPGKGVEGLRAAFHINRRLKAMSDKEGAESKEKDTNFCQDHSREKATMYCETCGVLICSKCVSKSSRHHGHNYDPLGKAFERYKAEIGASIKPMEEKLATVRKALEDLDANCSTITDQEASVETTISSTMRQIHKVLDLRQADLLDQLQQVTDAKMRDLSIQRASLENTQSQLTGCVDFMKESSEAAEGVRLTMRTTTSLHPDDLKPSVEADIRFEASPDVTEACQNFGEIKTLKSEPKRAKAIRDHKACGEDEISFTSGETIENIEKVNAKWWSGECKGMRGLFPRENVELM